MTKVEELKVKSYTVKVLGGMSIEDVPVELREFVALEVDKKTKEVL